MAIELAREFAVADLKVWNSFQAPIVLFRHSHFQELNANVSRTFYLQGDRTFSTLQVYLDDALQSFTWLSCLQRVAHFISRRYPSLLRRVLWPTSRARRQV